jgi:hypothetical protein
MSSFQLVALLDEKAATANAAGESWANGSVHLFRRFLNGSKASTVAATLPVLRHTYIAIRQLC